MERSLDHEPRSLEDVVEGVENLTDRKAKVSLGDALDEFGARSFGPVLILLPLIELSPIGGIPGIPTAIAILIALIALQILIGKEHIWIPDFIARRKMKSDKLGKFAHKLEGVAQRVDHLFHGRLKFLTRGIWMKAAALLIIGMCAMVPPLEIIPFASSAPMLAIAAFGLALLVRDGLLMLIATMFAGGSVVFAITALGSSASA